MKLILSLSFLSLSLSLSLSFLSDLDIGTVLLLTCDANDCCTCYCWLCFTRIEHEIQSSTPIDDEKVTPFCASWPIFFPGTRKVVLLSLASQTFLLIRQRVSPFVNPSVDNSLVHLLRLAPHLSLTLYHWCLLLYLF